jgi:hypothetical protein
MARSKSKDDRFQPSAETTRIVPMADGWFNVHTPDGKRLRRNRSELAYLVVEFDADTRTPGWFTRAAADLGLSDVLAEAAEITQSDNRKEGTGNE